MVQAKKGKSDMRTDDTLILPSFSLVKPVPGYVQRTQDSSGAKS